MKRNRQAGFGLVDMALSIGLVAIAMMMIFALYRLGRADSQSFAAAEEVIDLQRRVQDYYVEHNGYNDPSLSDALLLARNLVPDQMVRGTPAGVRTRWFSAVAAAPIDATTFRLTTSVPKDRCYDFVTRLSPHFRAIRLDSGAGWTDAALDGAPLNSVIAAQCSSRASVDVQLDSA
ncbi:hypothetical protein E4T66_17990 [Sinimarinibacterium sp. CAU 1509]|uniref:hypothetical protein n=1 Tax=Sinimarinibacterium sp. CAU 1509 TaxID=2562283 RepID=UPI0010AC738E|nr:hypothetical protein [Sinimarinibacterium sp. CAU 1509]TJY57297.1 hypothetical protein E4T66_17990 [Sinimarinibacterium sp. CAU 1509]